MFDIKTNQKKHILDKTIWFRYHIHDTYKTFTQTHIQIKEHGFWISNANTHSYDKCDVKAPQFEIECMVNSVKSMCVASPFCFLSSLFINSQRFVHFYIYFVQSDLYIIDPLIDEVRDDLIWRCMEMVPQKIQGFYHENTLPFAFHAWIFWHKVLEIDQITNSWFVRFVFSSWFSSCVSIFLYETDII